MKSEKNNTTLVVVLGVLVGVLLVTTLLFGYLVLGDNHESKVVEETETELDINSRLVQELYNMVGENENVGWVSYWRYHEHEESFSSELKDFYTASSSEEIKMNLVAKNLSSIKLKTAYPCDAYTKIPNNNEFGISCCQMNALYGSDQPQTYYDRADVEAVYKKIFGSTAELDTAVSFKTIHYPTNTYSYVAEYDAYFEYVAEVGGTGSNGGYTVKLDRAFKNGKYIYIYEDVTLEKYDGEVKTSTESFDMLYTFELEDDGMYKFVSRVKKDK